MPSKVLTYAKIATRRKEHSNSRDFLKKIIRAKKRTMLENAVLLSERSNRQKKLFNGKLSFSFVSREITKGREIKGQKSKLTAGHRKVRSVTYNYVKAVMRRMLRVRIAHGMDPTQRAGQTRESNERDASKYGRGKKRKSVVLSFLKVLLKLFFLIMFPAVFFRDLFVKSILKILEDKYKPKKNKKQSHVAKILSTYHNTRFAR